VTPDWLLTEYTTPVAGTQSVDWPVTVPGTGVAVVTETVKDELEVPQMLVADTVILPDNDEVPHAVVMALRPWPAVMDTPVGTTQLKATPAWLFTEKTTPVEALHTGVVPETVPGLTVPEMTVTAFVALTVPQISVAVTEMLPDTDAAPQLVTIELLPCPEVMVTPEGTDQL
jgi:hypothetical protein